MFEGGIGTGFTEVNLSVKNCQGFQNSATQLIRLFLYDAGYVGLYMFTIGAEFMWIIIIIFSACSLF